MVIGIGHRHPLFLVYIGIFLFIYFYDSKLLVVVLLYYDNDYIIMKLYYIDIRIYSYCIMIYIIYIIYISSIIIWIIK